MDIPFNLNNKPSNIFQYESGNYLSGQFKNRYMSEESINYFNESLFDNYNHINGQENDNSIIDNENYNQERNNFFKNYKKIIKSSSLKSINLGNKEYIQRLEDEENNNINPEMHQNNNISRNNEYGYIINENVTKTIQMNQDNFENYEFSDNDGIQWVLKKIVKMDDNNNLNILNTEGYLPKNLQNYRNKTEQYPILKLSNYFLKLANEMFIEVSKLIGPDTKTDILFNKICVILLIDNSCYINQKKKDF